MEQNQAKKSAFDNPLLKTKIKSANVKLFPEGLLGYLVGPTLALLANSILSSYFNRYMTDVLNITTWANTFFTLLPLISVIFVVIGNIIVGRLMDHSKTKAGKARPLLLLSLPVSIIALLVLFVFTPAPDSLLGASASANAQVIALVLIAIGYNLWFAIAYPLYYTPHASLVNLSTRNSKDRSLLATISNATALAAMGLSSMILPFFLGMLFVETGEVVDGVKVIDVMASYNNWKIFVIALMVITFVGALIEFFFTRERVTEESFAKGETESTKKAAPMGQQAKACFKDKFWWIMIVFFFLYQLGGMLKNVSQLYFCSAMFADANGAYSTAIGGTFMGTLSIVGAIPTAVGMVIAWPLSNKIGKGKAILFGAIVSVIGGAIGFIDPTNFPLVVASFVIKALGSTPAMYLSLALLADVLDHQEAMKGFRTDGLTMTIYGAIMAGMTGVATGIMNGILGAVGYSASTVSSPALQAVMPWIFIGGETICYGIIVIIFIFMGVEKFSHLDHKAIVKDQKAAADAEGKPYIDPAEKLRLEEEESERESQEMKLNDLKATCEKKGLDFKTEKANYLKKVVAEKAAAEAKKAADAEKNKAAEEARKAALQAKTEKLLPEYNKLREQNNKPDLTAEEAK